MIRPSRLPPETGIWMGDGIIEAIRVPGALGRLPPAGACGFFTSRYNVAMREPHDAHQPPSSKRLEYLKVWVDRRIARSHLMRARCAERIRRAHELETRYERWQERSRLLTFPAES